MTSLRIPIVAALLLFTIPSLRAQTSVTGTLPVNIRFTATEANAPPGTCGCFFLKGGAADAAVALLSNVAVAVEVAGNTVHQVTGTNRGLSTITLLAGPRYTVPLHRISISSQALFGAAHGFDADFSTGMRHADTATVFAMALGGFAEVQLRHTFAVRVAQVEYVQTNLPNGADNRQRNIRVGAGLTFRIPPPSGRR